MTAACAGIPAPELGSVESLNTAPDFERAYSLGVLVRAQADYLGVYPPLIFDTAMIDRVVDVIGEVLTEMEAAL